MASELASSHTLAIVAMGVFLCLAGILPLYNKALLTNLYPFPVTATWLQLVGVSTVMCLGRLVHSQGVNTVASTAADVPNTVIEDPQALHKVQTPTPHHHGQIDVWFKCRKLLLPSFVFVANMTLTNLGIQMTSVVVHIMLRASELVWVILLSSIHKQERPSKIEAVCCACIAAGTAITAVNSHSEDVSAAALTINLTSAVFGALHVVALRWASLTLHVDSVVLLDDETQCRLWGDDVYVSGVKQRKGMSSYQITTYSFCMASCFMWIPALAIEFRSGSHPFSELASSPCAAGMVVAGIPITLAFQGSVVALTAFCRSVTVGIVQQLKIIPAFVIAISISGVHLGGCINYTYSPLGHIFTSSTLASQVAGFVLILIASLVYARQRELDIEQMNLGKGGALQYQSLET